MIRGPWQLTGKPCRWKRASTRNRTDQKKQCRIRCETVVRRNEMSIRQQDAPVTPKVKICGITTMKEADWLNAAGADYAGFVF